MKNIKLFVIGCIGATSLLLTSCGSNSTESNSNTIAVSSTDTECIVSSTTSTNGTIVFDVTNDGSTVTEFYFLESDGQGIVGEVEDIGPGMTRSLAVKVSPGQYVTACKPGMKGDGIRATFDVK